MRIKVGQIGYMTNNDLGINKTGGHYVYVCEVKGNKVDVNVITSLEYLSGKWNTKRLNKVRKGYIYPIPKSHSTLPRWSAVSSNPKLNRNIKDIKPTKHKIKKRHRFFIGKFLK